MSAGLLLFRLLVLLLLAPLPAAADELVEALPELHPGPPALEQLVGEEIDYDIAFLWFDRLAAGRLTFEHGEAPGLYRALLEARTLGVAAWLTRDRVQRYESLMEIGPDGKLRSLMHRSQVIKGRGDDRKDRAKRYLFDHDRGEVVYERAREGAFERKKVMEVEGKPPTDILTAFYNFRAGLEGEVQPGREYRIPTISDEGPSEIVVRTLGPEERPVEDFFPAGGLLAQVEVDPEVFDTGGGLVYVWFDTFGRPRRGIVENIIGLGNVRGTARP